MGCYVLKILLTWVTWTMLFLAIHSEPQSQKDEVFLVQKFDVKSSILFVRNVLGPCIYLGQEHLIRHSPYLHALFFAILLFAFPLTFQFCWFFCSNCEICSFWSENAFFAPFSAVKNAFFLLCWCWRLTLLQLTLPSHSLWFWWRVLRKTSRAFSQSLQVGDGHELLQPLHYEWRIIGTVHCVLRGTRL